MLYFIPGGWLIDHKSGKQVLSHAVKKIYIYENYWGILNSPCSSICLSSVHLSCRNLFIWFKKCLVYIYIIGVKILMGFNSLRPSDAYIHQNNIPPLVQIMACHLSGTKSLSEPMLPCCLSNPKEHISLKFCLEFKSFRLGKCIWKSRLPKWRSSCPGLQKICCMVLGWDQYYPSLNMQKMADYVNYLFLVFLKSIFELEPSNLVCLEHLEGYLI